MRAFVRHRLTFVLLATMPGLLATSCGDDGGGLADPTGSSSTSGQLGGSLLVFAAASLADAFGAIEADFEAAHPGIDVQLNLAGSSALREQILEGAPADVFASANLSNMDTVVEEGVISTEPRVFVRNRLEIAVPEGNPAGVDQPGRLRRRRPADRSVRRGGAMRQSSPATRSTTPGSPRRSTPTSPTCAAS